MYNKIITNNVPLLDEMIYYMKRLSTECVVKNEALANVNETVESIRNYARYEECIENRTKFEVFDYTQDDFRYIMEDRYNTALVSQWMDDYSKIPSNYKISLLKNKIQYYLNNYNELNNYYRMLNGKPDIGDEGITLSKEFIELRTNRLSDEEGEIEKYTNKPLHELGSYEINALEVFGIIGDLITMYPDKKYLNYLGMKSLDIYKTRNCTNFSLLYIPEDIPNAILGRFKNNYSKNRVYTLKTVYNDAFKLGSNYYDNFIQLFIMTQTIIDTISEIPDIIINKDFFDIRTVRLMFKCYGIDTFDGIPIKYQISMIKNLNTLLKYKSTTRNIVDICSLFGFNNLEVFKYYMLKDRRKDKDGNFIFEYKDVIDEIDIIYKEEDIDKEYELKFIKDPIQNNLDDYIADSRYSVNYDQMTLSDKYWDGEQDHEYVKKQILDLEFNYLETKYISIDTVYDLTRMTYQLCYYYNMIFDKNVKFNLLRLSIPQLNSGTTFLLTDVICFLFSLMYEYQGIDDKITNPSQSAVLSILGFNFKANMATISQYILEKGYTSEDLGISEFQIPTTSPTSFKQLVYIFTKNTEIYDHIIKEMRTADNKEIYDIYKYLYDSLMITELSMDFFKIKKDNGSITLATSYTEYLSYKDPILYKKLIELQRLDSSADKQQFISDTIDNVLYALQEYLDGNEFEYIYSIYPTVSADAIKDYIYRVIDFFKSYKIQIYNVSTVYKFDDRLNNRVNVIDKVHIDHV